MLLLAPDSVENERVHIEMAHLLIQQMCVLCASEPIEKNENDFPTCLMGFLLGKLFFVALICWE